MVKPQINMQQSEIRILKNPQNTVTNPQRNNCQQKSAYVFGELPTMIFYTPNSYNIIFTKA